MRTKIIAVLVLVFILASFCAPLAFAEAWDDEGFHGIEPTYVKPEDLWMIADELDGDLGDEQIPVEVIGGLATLTMAGILVIHKKRQGIH